ncbi:MAG TPA: hypothetical protein VL947_09355 [Cytophagales bacterium]|nr:hypothetical protein [Cytophagales bacterium]
MLKNRRIPAYTIIELIIIMILTGILSALTFSALGLFSQNFILFQRITRRSYELTLLHKLLLKDIDMCQKLEATGEGTIRCVYADKEVAYEFEPEKILRRGSALVDTFYFSSQNYKYELMPASDNVVVGITFELKVSEQILPYIFKKEYPADIFVNQNTTQ